MIILIIIITIIITIIDYTRVAHEYQYTPNLLPLVKVSLFFCSYSNSFCRLMALDGVHWYWYWYVLMLVLVQALELLRGSGIVTGTGHSWWWSWWRSW